MSKQGVLDLTSSNFDVDAFVSKLLKEKSLDALVSEEENMVNCVRRLDSDVHQIVYENYNKFLTATSSVRKIEKEFSQLDKEMNSLSASMSSISSLVKEVSCVVEGRKGEAAALARSYKTVNAVQFVAQLPSTLQTLFDEQQFPELINLYLKAKKSLTPYVDIPNVKNVLDEVKTIVELTEKELRTRLGASALSVEQAGEAIELLAKLGVPEEELEQSLLEAAEATLRRDLSSLSSSPSDVLELVDSACSSFLPDLCLCASLYKRHFPDTSACMVERLRSLLEQLNTVIGDALLNCKPHDTALTVRSLDRFYSKCSAVSQHLPELNNLDSCARLVKEVSSREVKLCREKILSECSSTVVCIRESLLESSPLPPLVSSLLSSFIVQMKTALAHLLLFTASDVAFSSSQSTSSFRGPFACLVYEDIIVGANKDLSSLCATVCNEPHCSPFLSLVLSLVAHDCTQKVSQMEVLCKEQFSISIEESRSLCKEEEVISLWRNTAHELLTHFVHETALSIGDPWCNALALVTTPSQPRGVSVATRRMNEQLNALSNTISTLFGEETRKEPKQRERKTINIPIDALKDSLWSERVDLHANLHFKKTSMMTGISKGILKSGIEGVRMNTFGTYALQQIQVDVAFLQESLCMVIGDDPLVTSLFDSLLSSALRRCLNPQLLHPNVVCTLIAEEEDIARQ